MLRRATQTSFATFVRRQHGLNSEATNSTGIEHVHEANKRGDKNYQERRDYACAEYLNFGKYSYYEPEVSMSKVRVPQPTNESADVEPTVRK